MRRYPIFAVLFAALLLLGAGTPGCGGKKTTTGVPVATTAAPQTALQWTIVYNGALAKANRRVVETVGTVQKNGLITAAQARPIMLTCDKIQAASRKVADITSKGTEATWNLDGPKIREALDLIGSPTVSAVGNIAVDPAIALLNSWLSLLRAQATSPTPIAALQWTEHGFVPVTAGTVALY